MGDFSERTYYSAAKEILFSNPVLAVPSFLLIGIIAMIPLIAIIWMALLVIDPFQFTSYIYRPAIYFITLWSLVEILFFIYHLSLQQLVQLPSAPPPFSQSDRDSLFASVLSNTDDARDFLSKWFFGSEVTKVKIGNLRDWMSYSLWGKSADKLDPTEHKEVDEIVGKFILEKGLDIQEGKNTNLRFMKHILDPVRTIPRPFVAYLVTDTIFNGIATLVLKYLGYHRYTIQDLTCWSFGSNLENQESVVFFHGIGAGIVTYLGFILHLHWKKYQNCRIILISLPHISMRFPSTSNIPSMNQTVSSIDAILDHFSIKSSVFIGHSYGTACLSWILQKRPQIVSKAIFIDPVCFELSKPDVIYNFVYRKPKNVGQLFMWYFVCKELGIAYLIGRHFWWFQNVLFAHQLPKSNHHTKVFLSGSDCIINAKFVRKYLDTHQIQYHWAPKHKHGDFLLDKSSWKEIVCWI
jgi:pimeloyl-ACP methyl ester carboxylesterase